MILTKELPTSKSKRIDIKCDICDTEFDATYRNQIKSFKIYDKDTCRSCRQKEQYRLGLRENNKKRCRERAADMKGKTMEELFGTETAINAKLKMSIANTGENNAMYGNRDPERLRGFIKHQKYCKGKSFEEIYGEDKACEMKTKLSIASKGENNPMYGKPSPTGSGNGWSGWYKDEYFRSLMELSYIIYLNDNNIKYESAEQKKYAVKYVDYKGTERNYFPDYYLTDSDTMIEVKPKNLLNSQDNLKKFENTRKLYKFKIVTEDNLILIKPKDLKPLIESGEVKLIDRYMNKFKEKYEHHH